MAKDDLVERVRQRSPACAKVGVFDVDGIFRGKYMAPDKLASALARGFGFCDVVLGWDSSDQLYDNVDLHRLAHRLSRRRGAAAARDRAGDAVRGRDAARSSASSPARPRRSARAALLRRVLDRAASMGCKVKAAAEFEFFVFEETPHSVRDKGYRGLKPITPGHFGYSMLRSGVHSDFYDELWSTCDAMRIELEGLHTETGPGVIEGAIRFDDALEAADKAALFKTIVKILCQRRGWMATFMAKWSNDWPGSVRPSPHVAGRRGERQVALLRRGRGSRHVAGDALVRRRPAGADAGAAGDGRADGQRLHPADPRLLGADRRARGAMRTGPARFG